MAATSEGDGEDGGDASARTRRRLSPRSHPPRRRSGHPRRSPSHRGSLTLSKCESAAAGASRAGASRAMDAPRARVSRTRNARDARGALDATRASEDAPSGCTRRAEGTIMTHEMCLTSSASASPARVVAGARVGSDRRRGLRASCRWTVSSTRWVGRTAQSSEIPGVPHSPGGDRGANAAGEVGLNEKNKTWWTPPRGDVDIWKSPDFVPQANSS